MFNKELFIVGHQICEPKFYSTYSVLQNNVWKSYKELLAKQEKELRQIVKFAYNNVPYYHKLFKSLGLQYTDIKQVGDLEKLPVLTKQTILSNWNDFKPIGLSKMSYLIWSTGGTSGTPFNHRISKYDRFLGGAMLYRGWGYAGYELGDKMVFLAGSALDVGNKSLISNRIHEVFRNLKKLSSFDMGSDDMNNYVNIINSFKPKYLRGYPSSIHLLAEYIKENDLKVHTPVSIFTTSEKLYPQIKSKIETIFDCDVYDNYGLNDGGVSAYECSEHNGLHIDTERSVMEIVDNDGHQISDGCGDILATSLHNYSMPFIRYQTEDIGQAIEDTCGCGRSSRLLKEIIGRTVDILYTPEGKAVHGWFFLYIFWDYGTGVKEYQVVQEKVDTILIYVVKNDNFDKKQLDVIREIIRRKSPNWEVEFIFVDKIERSEAGKFKFIVNKVR